jgi:hypothetical protein
VCHNNFLFLNRKPGENRSITIYMDKKKVNNNSSSIEVSLTSNELMTKICDNVPITKQMYDELLPNPMKPFRRMAGKFQEHLNKNVLFVSYE